MAQNSDKSAKKKRGPGKPFEAGKSGNPGGRPKELVELQTLAREHTAEAVTRLVALMRGDNDRVAVAAISQLLDRAWGKPPQALEHTGASEITIVVPSGKLLNV